MDEPIKKRVDESWKEHAAQAPAPAPAAGPAGPSAPQAESGEAPHAQFDLFISSLAMEAFIALGDMPHPVTRKQAANLTQAKYLIDLLGILETKTKGNLSVDEQRLLTDALYQLRMRYMTKAGT
ncbi:MAG: DUF1844 domain-containing protein [Candidatus Omnitrophica bacterium]|nr:DUF1844 domain-containing protein [Candidatus Omnitrophota bacterium]